MERENMIDLEGKKVGSGSVPKGGVPPLPGNTGNGIAPAPAGPDKEGGGMRKEKITSETVAKNAVVAAWVAEKQAKEARQEADKARQKADEATELANELWAKWQAEAPF